MHLLVCLYKITRQSRMGQLKASEKNYKLFLTRNIPRIEYILCLVLTNTLILVFLPLQIDLK